MSKISKLGVTFCEGHKEANEHNQDEIILTKRKCKPKTKT